MSEIPPEKTCRLALHPAENVYIHRFRRKYTFFHKARKIAGLLLFLFSFLRCLSSPPFLFTHLRAGFMWRFLRRERGGFRLLAAIGYLSSLFHCLFPTGDPDPVSGGSGRCFSSGSFPKTCFLPPEKRVVLPPEACPANPKTKMSRTAERPKS